MTYAVELANESSFNRTFVKIFPVRELPNDVGQWTLVSGTIYKYQLPYNYRVARLYTQTTATSTSPVYQAEVSTPSITGSQWYFDEATREIYFRINDVTLENIFVELEMLFCSEFVFWNRIPDDDTSTLYEWGGYILKSPERKITLADTFFGFSPSQTSSLQLSNEDHYIEQVLDIFSFKDARIDVWKQFGNIQTDNFRKLFTGFINSYEYTVDGFSFSLNDENKILENTVSSGIVSASFASSGNPIDPAFLNTYRRYMIAGRVEGVKLVNAAYKDDANDPDDNHLYVYPFPGINALEYFFQDQIDNTFTHTTTRIYILPEHIDSFEVGDIVQIQFKTGFPFPIFTADAASQKEITAVGANYIDFTPALGVAYTDATHFAARPIIKRVYVEQDNVSYVADPFRDYESDVAGRISFTFGYDGVNSYTNMGMPDPIKHSSRVFCASIHNRHEIPTFNSSPICDPDIFGGLSNGVGAIYFILKEILGIPESDLDGPGFITACSTYSEEVAIFAPVFNGSGEQQARDIIAKLLLSLRMRLFKNKDDKWTVRRILPFSTPTWTLTDDDIIENSFSVSYSYDDIISRSIVKYRQQDRLNSEFLDNDVYFSTSFENEFSRVKHRFKAEKTFETYLYDEADAQDLAEFLTYYFSDRRAIATLRLRREYFDIEIGDQVRLERSKLPGVVYDPDTLGQKDFVVIGTLKDRDTITLTLDDQKGLEDNS